MFLVDFWYQNMVVQEVTQAYMPLFRNSPRGRLSRKQIEPQLHSPSSARFAKPLNIFVLNKNVKFIPNLDILSLFISFLKVVSQLIKRSTGSAQPGSTLTD